MMQDLLEPKGLERVTSCRPILARILRLNDCFHGHSGRNYSMFPGSTNNNEEPRNVECKYTLDNNRSLEQR
jgi:hypothetical protein